MRYLCPLIVLAVVSTTGCALSSRYEHLHVASGTRIFWHTQPGDIKTGIGFRERDGKPTEVILLVRNDGILPANLPQLSSATAALYVNGKRVELKAGEKAGTGKMVPLEAGASRSCIIPYGFEKGKSYRVFGGIGPIQADKPRSRLVTPEVAVSAVFGPPLRFRFTRWSEK